MTSFGAHLRGPPLLNPRLFETHLETLSMLGLGSRIQKLQNSLNLGTAPKSGPQRLEDLNAIIYVYCFIYIRNDLQTY
jgi:hypothetical protein